MKITTWRIVKTKRSKEPDVVANGVEMPAAFDGVGASLYPGRWNNKGTPMVYTASSQSLASLEILVHIDDSALLQCFSIFPVQFDSKHLVMIEDQNEGKTVLRSKNWQANPPDQTTRTLGDAWVHSSESLVLAVPSAVIPSEINYLINPYHADFSALEIGKPQVFPFDKRFSKPR